MIVTIPERIPVQGNVLVEVHDAATRRLLHSVVAQNKIPLVGRTLLGAVLIGDTALSGQPPSHVAVGTATSSPADTDTQLGNEVYRSVITQKAVAAGVVTWKFFIPSVAANGYTLTEAMLVNSSDIMQPMPILSRVVHTPIAKTPNVTVTYTWVHTFTST